MIDLNHLNPPQRKAVEYIDGLLLVIAGAGSGKMCVIPYFEISKNGINNEMV